MTYKEFCAQHFNNNEEEAIRHLVQASYYKDYSITENRENLQAILDTMTRDETKAFMKELKIAVKANPKPMQKAYAPLFDAISGTDTSWKYNENFIKRGNPFGKEIKKYSIISLVGIGVLAILYFALGNVTALKGTNIFPIVCLVFFSLMSGTLVSAARNYFIFKKAEKELLQSEQTENINEQV